MRTRDDFGFWRARLASGFFGICGGRARRAASSHAASDCATDAARLAAPHGRVGVRARAIVFLLSLCRHCVRTRVMVLSLRSRCARTRARVSSLHNAALAAQHPRSLAPRSRLLPARRPRTHARRLLDPRRRRPRVFVARFGRSLQTRVVTRPAREKGARARRYQQWNLTSGTLYRSRKTLRENRPCQQPPQLPNLGFSVVSQKPRALHATALPVL